MQNIKSEKNFESKTNVKSRKHEKSPLLVRGKNAVETQGLIFTVCSSYSPKIISPFSSKPFTVLMLPIASFPN